MSNKDWLQLAAKAAGMRIHHGKLEQMRKAGDAASGLPVWLDGCWRSWNPLADGGDALRLAAKLRLDIQHHEDGGVWFVAVDSPALLGHLEVESYDDTDATQALCCAIVRCAAEVGRGMSASEVENHG